MSGDVLLKRLRAAREFIVELAPGKTLTLRRPTDFRLRELMVGITPATLVVHAVAWSGVTEADLLGQALGSDAVVEFDAAVAEEALEMRSDWFGVAASALMAAVTTHLEAKAAAAKN